MDAPFWVMVTTAPPAGAAPASVMVPVVTWPPTAGLGLKVSLVRHDAGGFGRGGQQGIGIQNAVAGILVPAGSHDVNRGACQQAADLRLGQRRIIRQQQRRDGCCVGGGGGGAEERGEIFRRRGCHSSGE